MKTTLPAGPTVHPSETDGAFDLGKTNYQRVRDVIRSDIINGQFQAGDRLKISELATRYGISAIPIREALHQLQGEGLIVISANRGASVRRIDERFLWQIYEIRKALEMHFIAILAEHASRDDVARLQALVNAQDDAVAKADEELFQELDREFHMSIVGATANEEALAVLNRTYNLTRPLRLRYGRTPDHRNGIQVDHRALVDAIGRRDAPRARALVSEHIDRAFIDLASVMKLEDDVIRRRLRAGTSA
jgi:DNA-binding GntR family transcriptional regulator